MCSIQCEPRQPATNTCHRAVGVPRVYTLQLHESQYSLWQSRRCSSHTAVNVAPTPQPGHACWPAGSVEHLGLMSFHVGRAGLTAGGRPLRHSEGFSMFLWWWRYCSAVISLAHCGTRISWLFWLLHFFPVWIMSWFFLIVYCLWYLWNMSTYQSVSWWPIILPPSLFLTTVIINDIKF